MRQAARAAISLAPFVMVYVGLRVIAGDGFALLGTGLLVYVDLQIPQTGGR